MATDLAGIGVYPLSEIQQVQAAYAPDATGLPQQTSPSGEERMFTPLSGSLSATIDANGTLTLMDNDVVGRNNDITLSIDPDGQLVIRSNNDETFVGSPTGFVLAPDSKTLTSIGRFAGHIGVDTRGGYDQLTIDYAMETFTNPVDYRGGGDQDVLRVLGASYGNHVFNYAGPASGSIAVAGGATILFSGIGSSTNGIVSTGVIDFTSAGGTLTFNLTVDSDDVRVGKADGNKILLQGPSTFAATKVNLANVTGVLINGNGGDDLLGVDASYRNADPTLDLVTLDGADRVAVSGVVNSIETGDGTDRILLSSANSRVLSGIRGGDGLDTLTSNRHSDALFAVDGAFRGTAAGVGAGFSEIENIRSGVADDTIVVADQAQIGIVSAGSGNDTFSIRGYAESVSGGNGDNFLLVDLGASLGSYEGGAQRDRVVLRGTFTNITTGDGNDAVTVGTTGIGPPLGNGISTGVGDDAVQIHGIVGNKIRTDAGNDRVRVLQTGRIDASVDLGEGDDYAIVLGHISLGTFGGAGNDWLSAENSTLPALLYGGAGNDVIVGGMRADFLDGGAGNDTLRGMGGTNLIFGGAGKDTITGGTGANAMFGEGGNDTITGQLGQTFAIGGAGADTIIGGSRYNVLFGGLGVDVITAAGNYGTFALGDATQLDAVVRDGEGNVAATWSTSLFALSDTANVNRFEKLRSIMASWASFPTPTEANLSSRIADITNASTGLLKNSDVIADGANDSIDLPTAAFDAYYQIAGDTVRGATDGVRKKRIAYSSPAPQAEEAVTISEGKRDEEGFLVHEVQSPYQAGLTQIRVLQPDQIVAGKKYTVVYILPATAPESESIYGDGLEEVQKLDLQNKLDVVFVAPTFSDVPWYADNPSNLEIRQETYFRKVVVPFIDTTYQGRADADGRLLLGFSKSGWGAWSLLLRHPDEFGKAAAFDSPLMMDTLGKYGSGPIFGTQENFDNYRIDKLLESKAEQFQSVKRLILLGYYYFEQDEERVHDLLVQLEIAHEYREGPERAHNWESGWVQEAVELLVSA